MFGLLLRDGSQMEIEAPDLLAAMRHALRMNADLRIEGCQSRVMRQDEIRQSLELDRPGLFEPYNAEWQPPSTAEFRALLGVAELTGSQAGKLVGVAPGKIRKWAGGEGAPPYAVWRLLTLYTGLAPLTTWDNGLTK